MEYVVSDGVDYGELPKHIREHFLAGLRPSSRFGNTSQTVRSFPNSCSRKDGPAGCWGNANAMPQGALHLRFDKGKHRNKAAKRMIVEAGVVLRWILGHG
jgi:hypothetical protein